MKALEMHFKMRKQRLKEYEESEAVQMEKKEKSL